MTWTCTYAPDSDDAHVLPDADLIAHLPVDCICGLTVEPVPRDDGSMGWLVTHHSLDGRENTEQPRR